MARTEPISDVASDMLKAICSAGERCSCADKNYQWRDANCEVAIAHVNAISRRLFGTMGAPPSHRMTNLPASTISEK